MLTTKVMIMDDEPEIGELIQEIAELKQIKAEYCCDPYAFETMLANAPETELIFLDLNMPGRDGVEILRTLATHHFQGELILMSGFDASVLATAQHLAQAYGLHLKSPLTKPFSTKKILEILSDHLFNFSTSTSKKRPLTEESTVTQIYSTEQILHWLEAGQLVLHYQPQIELKHNKVIGIESLVRLIDDNGQLVYPAAFIHIVEIAQATKLLLEKVLERICIDYSNYHDQLQHLRISVNVSALDLDRLSFPDELYEKFSLSRLPISNVTVEITESQAIDQIKTGLDILVRLRLKGFLLSIDDFGTGKAVLGNVRQMPYNELKIDKSFIDQLIKDDKTHTLTKDLIRMAQNLNLTLVAEGIENAETADCLRAMGCNVAQGYYFSEPMPADQLVCWLNDFAHENNG